MNSFQKCTVALIGLTVSVLSASAKDVDAKFKKMDTDGDGRISREEHAAGSGLMFTQMDANSDGRVTAAEMSAKKDSRADSSAAKSASTRGDPKADTAEATEKIKMIDQNADGELTVAEHEAGSVKMFDQMDSDRDGALTEQELAAGVKQMKKNK